MRSQLFRASAAPSMSAGERSALAPLTMRIEFSPDGSTMIGATPLDWPATRLTWRVSIPSLSRIPDGRVGEHVVADRRDHDDGSPQLGRRGGLIGALPAVSHFEAGGLDRLAPDRHARHIGHEIDHVAADDRDARLRCRRHGLWSWLRIAFTTPAPCRHGRPWRRNGLLRQSPEEPRPRLLPLPFLPLLLPVRRRALTPEVAGSPRQSDSSTPRNLCLTLPRNQRCVRMPCMGGEEWLRSRLSTRGSPTAASRSSTAYPSRSPTANSLPLLGLPAAASRPCSG